MIREDPISTPEIREYVDQRLDELYWQYREIDESEIVSYYTPGVGYGKPETLAPEHRQFAICLATTDGELFYAGDHDWPFALQSISKVVVYALALEGYGRDAVLKRVGVRPTGDAFNSISVLFDERHNRPHNPMVNAGALVTTDLVRELDPATAIPRIIHAFRRFAGNPNLDIDEDLYAKEMGSTDRNRGLSYIMRSFGMISDAVEETLALYLRHCAIQVTVRDLALMAVTLANGGMNPVTGERALAAQYTRDVLSVMHTCGMYDFAGEWAYRVGIPAKSGVSGGIMAVVPGKLGIGVFSPGLDEYGNSVRGAKVCEEISKRRGLHVFAAEAEDTLLGPPRSKDETEREHPEPRPAPS